MESLSSRAPRSCALWQGAKATMASPSGTMCSMVPYTLSSPGACDSTTSPVLWAGKQQPERQERTPSCCL
eukprot:10785589-Lingulodinium_polyedra.AAC.1